MINYQEIVKKIKGKLTKIVGYQVANHNQIIPERATKQQSLKLIKSLGFTPNIVIDVGAQIGTPELYEVFPDAHHILIEPVQENEQALQNVCNKLKNAEYIIAAATLLDSDVYLRVSDNTKYSSIVAEKDQSKENFSTRKVKGIKIDTLCQVRNLTGPFLIKIDVDGKEIDVLNGCIETLKSTTYIIIETTTVAAANASIFPTIQFMRQQNFDVYDIVDLVYRPSMNDLWQVDIAFVKKDSELLQYKGFLPPEEQSKFYGK